MQRYVGFVDFYAKYIPIIHQIKINGNRELNNKYTSINFT